MVGERGAHLQEENMRHVQLPRLMLGAKLRGLPEDLLYHRKIFSIPIDFSLSHEYRNVPAQGSV